MPTNPQVTASTTDFAGPLLTAPSTERTLEIFSTLSRHHNDDLVKISHPELTAQQEQVLELMNVPPSVYTQLA